MNVLGSQPPPTQPSADRDLVSVISEMRKMRGIKWLSIGSSAAAFGSALSEWQGSEVLPNSIIGTSPQ